MKVLAMFPPNYAAINAKFNVRGKNILFSYGDTIYNPSRVVIPPELMVHEAVHGRRQGADPSGWWNRYIEDPEFRLNEEIPAHRAEFQEVMKHGMADYKAIRSIAERLSGPLYGRMIDVASAERAIMF